MTPQQMAAALQGQVGGMPGQQSNMAYYPVAFLAQALQGMQQGNLPQMPQEVRMP